MRLAAILLVGVAVFLAAFAPAQPKPAVKKDAPRPLLCIPLGIVPGVETKVIIRGQHLDTATAVRFGNVKATVKIVRKGRANVPNMQDAAKVGDTQLEVKVTLPADFAGKEAAFTVVTAAGESTPHQLLVDKTPTTVEKEPNNGFKQAQVVKFPQVLDGAIDHSQDVDVFRFDGQAEQRVVIEVFAARFGSALDSFLTLYNADGQILASNDDVNDSTKDSRLETTLPKTGAYYVSVLDANDTGSAVHVYRLVIRAK